MSTGSPKQAKATAVTKPRRLSSIPPHWQEYGLCIVLHMFLPLLPLILELWMTGDVQAAGLFIAAAMYSIAIGMSSSSKLIFGCCLVITILFSVVYGAQVVEESFSLSSGRAFAVSSIAMIFLVHGAERYNYHVVDMRPFLDF